MTATYVSIASVPTSESFNPANLVIQPEPWMRDGKCQEMDPDLFFPPNGERVSEKVKAVCEGCPAKLACAAFALRTNQQHGTWGGLGPRELNEIRRAAKR